MRRMICLMALVGFLAACGGVGTMNTGIHIPEADSSQSGDPSYAEGWNRLKSGDPKGALSQFQKSGVQGENLFVGYGYAYLIQNKISLAQRNFEKALEINPENLNASLGVASVHELQNEPEQAFRIYSRLRAANPGNLWVKGRHDYIKTQQTQGCLKAAQQKKDAGDRQGHIDLLRKASFYSPELPDIQIQIADFHFAEAKYEDAARFYENVLNRAPNRLDMLEKAALAYEKAQRYDTAIILYNRLLELKPGDSAYIAKVTELKALFLDLRLPEKFKKIFFKSEITREDLAALIGYYFDRYLDKRVPVIITDIGGSFAQSEIIGVCTLGIMNVRPDHSFDRFPVVTRAAFATVIDNLLKYLRNEKKLTLNFDPSGQVVEPRDISNLHKQYSVVRFLVNAQLIVLDSERNFDPTRKITPSETLAAIRKIVNSIGD